ncbi:MAG TPA: coproporphyrinogen dehydrogenase HemZ, partial [Bacillota bacterium]|nr:coproporphyrinogen dehydrogenase HemZ [Bacillota bacterium]
MRIFFDCEPELAKACHDIVRVFYPDAEFLLVPDGADFSIRLQSSGELGDSIQAELVPLAQSGPDQVISRLLTPSNLPEEAAHNRARRTAKLAVMQLLADYSGRQAGPWGILTGIRPTKIVHRFLDQGYSSEAIVTLLTGCYGMSEAKSRFLVQVATRQRPFLHSSETAGNYVSIYIGIPFCPTRCVYCSFPAYSIKAHSRLVEPFVQALLQEIRATGEFLRESGREVESVYIGGGTPTSLSADQLAGLLQEVKTSLWQPSTREFTVEAGRPDTINIRVLELLRQYGVDRLSINPQSMQAETLKTIGRAHSPADVVEAVALARQTGFTNINMDLIIGLPGELLPQVESTLTKLRAMEPENLTVHTLALKRASFLKEQKAAFKLADPEEVGRMLDLTYLYASQQELQPYYLYR